MHVRNTGLDLSLVHPFYLYPQLQATISTCYTAVSLPPGKSLISSLHGLP